MIGLAIALEVALSISQNHNGASFLGNTTYLSLKYCARLLRTSEERVQLRINAVPDGTSRHRPCLELRPCHSGSPSLHASHRTRHDYPILLSVYRRGGNPRCVSISFPGFGHGCSTLEFSSSSPYEQRHSVQLSPETSMEHSFLSWTSHELLQAEQVCLAQRSCRLHVFLRTRPVAVVRDVCLQQGRLLSPIL